MTTRLHVAALAKSVPGPRRLFAGLDLAVAAGELVAIVGESGVGKSTLLNILAGLDDADAGDVAIDGTPLGPLDEAARTQLRREKIGFVFQAFHILPYLTLRQNVALPLALVSADRRAATARADEMLAAVGLGDRGDGYARDLSGGELQRVAIARALVHRPALILADEPTGNLDPATAARVLALFAAAVRDGGAAGVMVTHSETTAAAADRVLVLTGEGLTPSSLHRAGETPPPSSLLPKREGPPPSSPLPGREGLGVGGSPDRETSPPGAPSAHPPQTPPLQGGA